MTTPEEKLKDLEQKKVYLHELLKRLNEATVTNEKQDLQEEIESTIRAMKQDNKDADAILAKEQEISDAKLFQKFETIFGKEETEELWKSRTWETKRVLRDLFDVLIEDPELRSKIEDKGFTVEEIIKSTSLNLLPNAENAVIDIRKLRDYSLNRDHSTGKDKARLFSSILGMTAENAEELRQIILEQVKIQEACLNKSDQHGQRYYVDFTLIRENKSANIRSCWIIKPGSDSPRLTSCYIKL